MVNNMKVKKFYLILIILSIIAIIFVYNDYFLYKTTIVKVSSVYEINNKNQKDEYYDQKIFGIVKNGKFKGNKITVINSTSISSVYDDKINNNSDIFVELTNNGTKANKIIGIKRDKYIVILVVIFIDLLLLLANKKGAKILLSLIINILITLLSILLFSNYYQKVNILILYLLLSILYIVISLFITNGINKKSISAITSSIVSLYTSFGLLFLLLKVFEKDISLWTMDYIEVVYDYKNFFYVCVLLSGLGAIMDISITISSSLNELILKDNKISKDKLLKSGKEISKDVIGTMCNVMLFTCYTSVIPIVFLAIRNNIPLFSALNNYGQTELIIVLCSCISIVFCVPISLYISTMILKKKEVK